MENIKAAEWLMYFYIYCFAGWVWESCYVSAAKRKLINRGFLKGPLLPIYGSGAVCILWVTAPVQNHYFLMAVIGMVAATLLEYVTGAVMEALFKVRYWDYSNNFLNVKGYICLKSTICWGVMTFLVVYVIHPPVAALVARMQPGVLYGADFVITALAAADFATSFKAAMDFRDVLVKAERMKEELKNIQKRLDELEEALVQAKDTLLERSAEARDALFEKSAGARDALFEKSAGARDALFERSAEARDALFERSAGAKAALLAEFQDLMLRKRINTEALRSQYSRSIHGLLKRNPGAVSGKYTEALEEIKATIREQIEKARQSRK